MWCENSVNRNSNVSFIFRANCVKLGSRVLDLQLVQKSVFNDDDDDENTVATL